MKFSLSTNWSNQRLGDGEAIAEEAMSLGFEELELGYNTTPEQVPGFRRALDRIPVGSVHAFCPVPISAPQGYPELYQLASFDEEGRRMASLQVRRNVEFAASMGADALVLHAGRVSCLGLLRRFEMRRRVRRGRRMLDPFRRELEALVPVLEKNKVTLGLENLPYLEGFPAEWEIGEVAGDWVKPWFDTGHDRVRTCRGWTRGREGWPASPVGMHINDVVDVEDDHFAPGMGKVDFAALKPMAESARHVVFEPNAGVSEADLRRGVEILRSLWRPL
ncbi:MAG: TIM barrel protein [Kiritimatiellae bacterium]|nr:TIM barrel protein [Kiritimatiellia bacterium]